VPSVDNPSLLKPARPQTGSRPPGGLGQGLARILGQDDDRSSAGQSGLHQLLGRGLPSTSKLVRDFVVETALGAIADGFDAEAVVITRRDGSGQLAVVSSRIPPSWAEATSLTFELFGMLWYWLDHASYAFASPGSDQPAEGEAGPLGESGRHLWIGCQPLATGHLAAAVVRGTPFSEVEEVTLGRLVRSVAVALGGEIPVLPPGASLAVTVAAAPDRTGDGAAGGRVAGDAAPGDDDPAVGRPAAGPAVGGGGETTVEVCLDVAGERRRAEASGPTPELATARAAARLCDPSYEVSFAGQTEIDGSSVTIVLVDDGRGSAFLGLAVAERGDLTGAAEAVLSAVALGGLAGRD
jgi:hypothetical protein